MSPFSKDSPWAVLAAERARRRTNNRWKALLIVSALFGALAGYLAGYEVHEPERHNTNELPAQGELVIAFKARSWHQAFADENGDFRETCNGHMLGTVTHWKRVQ